MGDETIGAVDKLPRYDLVISHFMLPFYICCLLYTSRGRMALFHNKENILLTREELQALILQ